MVQRRDRITDPRQRLHSELHLPPAKAIIQHIQVEVPAVSLSRQTLVYDISPSYTANLQRLHPQETS